jgi:hypothetical protein
MSVLVFHPSVAPHVQQVARALAERNQLARFVTSVRDQPESIRQKLLVGLGRLAGLKLEREFARRAVTGLPPELVVSHPWGELGRVAVARLDRDQRLSDFIWEQTEYGFDRRVARGLSPDLTGVYGYESSCLTTFRRAAALGIPTAYDVPAPDPQFMQDVFESEADKGPEVRTAYHRHTAVREPERMARRRAEWSQARVVIVASTFTRDTYATAGLDVSRVRVVPLGAPPPASAPSVLRAPFTAPLRLIWAGGFNARKGALYLLEAWRRGSLGRTARLDVFGSVSLPDRILHPLPAGVTLHGSIPRAELMRHYAAADALVFPTLGDGFGMVATEAWSQGVPVIMTDRAGAADLLRPGVNGLRVRSASTEALLEAIAWCSDHRAELAAMREGAVATAASWQWQDYRRKIAQTLAEAGMIPSS